MASRFYDRTAQVVEAYGLPQFEPKSRQLFCSDNGKRRLLSYDQIQTLNSSSATISSCLLYNSPITISFPSNGSLLESRSPDSSQVSGSCVTEDMNDLKHKLQELETVMLGPDSDVIDSIDSTTTCTKKVDGWRSTVAAISRRDLKQVLTICAKAVSDNDTLTAQWLIDELRQMVSVSGEPMQRLGAYMLEGLVARLASSGSSIYKSLKCREPESSELLSYMHVLYEVCPYFKFGYMSANGAIAEAMKEENKVHIVDFQIGQGSQWITLIQAFAARRGGPPSIRITGIDDAASAYARGGGLSIVGSRLSRLAKQFKVPFEFNATTMSGSNVWPENLVLRPGEALAVNFAFVLHHMPDESVSTLNHRDSLLRMVKSLSPKVVTLVEQESNTNTAPFFPRFVETLNYYTAMFESIDVTLPREHRERISVEQHCLARDIVNIVACEGAERVERHEMLGKWKSRFTMAGFKRYPLSSLVNLTIKSLLRNYSDKYRLEERDGALYLGWMNRDLVASCAWK